MKITVLDAATLGDDISLDCLRKLGDCDIYNSTDASLVKERIAETNVVILNKVKLNETNLCDAKKLRLICVCATGYDNIDVDYCRGRGIAVCNVEGYSSHSVAQTTVGMVLSLWSHLAEYNNFVTSGKYSKSGVANRLTPVYHEIWGRTWGIVGYGNIGKEVGDVAKALGCRVIVCKRTPLKDVECVDIDTLCREADIITVHTPLSDGTKHLINEDRLSKMKNHAVLVNTARGLVTDETAVAKAVSEGKIGAFGTDVYSLEPLSEESPLYNIKDLNNVMLTPHMAWGAQESRKRCISEVCENIKDFVNGGTKGRVDI